MKKFKKLTALLTAGTIWAVSCFGGVSVWGAQQNAAAGQAKISSGTTAGKTTVKRRGWYTMKDGVRKRYYWKDGNYFVGVHLIKGKFYYFNQKGILQKNVWFTSKAGNKYYFGADGVRYSGLQKVGKKYYFFSKKNGVMKTRTVQDGNVTYYIKADGVVEARKKGSKYYNADGTAMGKTEGYEYETLQTAKRIVSEITNSSMSEAQKLETCFRWVMAKYYTNRRIFLKQDGWPALYANDHFLLGGGDCYSDGCAFAYLAKALGYKNIYVCVDTDKVNNNGHCWAEINGLVYDPLFAQAKSFSRNYGVRYGVYVLSPRLKKAV